MGWLAWIAAIFVGAGSALAVWSTDRRFSILGVSVALVAAPLTGNQPPDLLALAFREVAVLTGSYLLWIATRHGVPGAGIAAPPFAPLFVGLAFMGAVALSPSLGPDRGSGAALAAAAASGVAALALGIEAPTVLSGGLGAIMLLLSASLAVAGLSAAEGRLDHAVIGAALLAVTTAAAFLGSHEPRPVEAPDPQDASSG